MGSATEDRVVTVLHLSDLHFEQGHKGSRPKRREAANRGMFERLEALAREGKEAREAGNPHEDWTPDLVAVSGDVGYTGSREDYLVARSFFDDLLGRLDLPPDRVVVCPGNHDRDWTRAGAPLKKRGKALYPQSSEESDKWLNVEALTPSPGGKPKPTVRPFLEFGRFCDEAGFLRPEGIKGLEYLTGRCSAAIDDVSVEFLVVNSAWCSAPSKHGGTDPQNLWLGLELLEELGVSIDSDLPREAEDRLCIGLCHHPLDWLNPAEFYALDGRPATYRALTQNCHAVLSGHVHSLLEPPSRLFNFAQVFTGGAVYTRDALVSNNLSLLKFDLDDHSVGRRGFELRPSENRWEELELSRGTYHLHNSDASEPPVTHAVCLNGGWESVLWQELKPSFRKKWKSISLSHVGEGDHGSVIYQSGATDDVAIRGELRDGFFSGYWDDEAEGRHGTFQVKVKDGGDLLAGRWVGFDNELRIQSGYWRFRRR